MQNLNQSILLNLAIGLPPLAEQRRILAKVDELMALCNRLEASLEADDGAPRRLLDAGLVARMPPRPEARRHHRGGEIEPSDSMFAAVPGKSRRLR